MYIMWRGFLLVLSFTLREGSSEPTISPNSTFPVANDYQQNLTELDIEDQEQVALGRGSDFLLSQRDPTTFGWGQETHRAVTALALAGTFWDLPSMEQTLAIKEMQLQLAVALANQHKEHLSAGQLALYINGLLSVCLNPRDFFGINLVSSLNHRLANTSDYEYALVSLALCNAGAKLSKSRFLKFVDIMRTQQGQPYGLDSISMTMLAFTCGLESNPMPALDRYVSRQVKVFKKGQNPEDGSFTNLFITSLIWQVFLATNANDKGWNRSLTREYVLSQQQPDGSFTPSSTGFMGTFFTLPPLANRTFASLANWSCPHAMLPNNTVATDKPDNETSYIGLFISVRGIGITTYTVSLKIRDGDTLYEGLVSNQEHLSTEWLDKSYGHMLAGVNGVNQNVKANDYWLIHIVGADGKEHGLPGGADTLFPKAGDHYVLVLALSDA